MAIPLWVTWQRISPKVLGIKRILGRYSLHRGMQKNNLDVYMVLTGMLNLRYSKRQLFCSLHIFSEDSFLRIRIKVSDTCDGSSTNIFSRSSRACRSKLCRRERKAKWKLLIKVHVQKRRYNIFVYFTYCLKNSLTRLFKGRAGLKLLYQGILETPGQMFSSGDPQSSKILFNCSCWTNAGDRIYHLR